VEPEGVGQTRTLEEGFPRTVVQILMSDGRTLGIREHPFGDMLTPSRGVDPVLLQSRYRQLGQSDGAASCVGLRGIDYALVDAPIDP
jgi:hypothetical protein